MFDDHCCLLSPQHLALSPFLVFWGVRSLNLAFLPGGLDLNISQELKVLISCHPDDLHIIFDDKGRDFLIFGNHDGSHRAVI